MFDDPHIAQVSAEINGGEYSPSGLRFSMDVDTFPTVSANVSAPKGDTSVKAPMSSEVLERIKQLQTQRLAGRTEPDFSVHAEDGLGGEIDYEGFVVAPLIDISKVSTHDRISSVGRAAMLDALDLSIYEASYALAREESGNDLKPLPSAETGDVAKVIADITDSLVGNYEAVLAGEYMPVAQEMLRLQHSINTDGPLDLWKEILGGSKVKYESWDAAFRVAPAIARALTERTKDFLVSQESGFWSHIQSLLSNFHMYYVPEFDGPGRFERSDKKMAEPTATIKASVTGLSVSDGSTRILPPGGVVMMMRAAPTERQEAQADPNIPRVVAYAPDPFVPGFIHRAPPPFWLSREEGLPIFGSEIDRAPATPGSVSLSLAKRLIAKAAGRAYKGKTDTVSEGVMTELCEVIFKELQLAQSTVSVSLPLDFSVSDYIGQRVTVKINSGSILSSGGKFTAFASGVTHSVALDAGKQLNSSTELRLTHVDYR